MSTIYVVTKGNLAMPAYVRQNTSPLKRGSSDRHPGLVWIEAHKELLPDNRWIAASRDGLVAAMPTISELMKEIEHKHINPSEVAIAFNTSDAVS